MRTRTRDQQVWKTPQATYVQTYNYEPTHSSKSDPVATLDCSFPFQTGSIEQTSDVVTPNYAARSGRGEIFNNPFSSIKSQRDDPILTTSSYGVPYAPGYNPAHKHATYFTAQVMNNSVNGLNQYGSPASHLGGEISPSANLVNLAGTQAAAGIDAPTFDGATFIAELRETIGFLRNPLGSLIRGLEKVRRAKRAGNKYARSQATFEYLRDNWLSYRYAIRPLIFDVEDAAVAVAETVTNHRPIRRTSRGGASDTFNFSDSGSSGLYDHSTETSVKVSVRAGVLYEFHRSPNTFGVGIERTPVAAWEAIPGSFIVDWAFNIGTFLEAITPVGGIQRLAAWTTKVVTKDTTREIWWARGGVYAPNGQTRLIFSNGKSTEKLSSETKTRTPGISIGLAHTVSPLSGDIGKLRTLDLVAITSQILRSK